MSRKIELPPIFHNWLDFYLEIKPILDSNPSVMEGSVIYEHKVLPLNYPKTEIPFYYIKSRALDFILDNMISHNSVKTAAWDAIQRNSFSEHEAFEKFSQITRTIRKHEVKNL